MGMKLAAFLILRSASLHLFSIWPTKLQRRVAPNFRARFCISSEMYGSHFWMDSDSFSTFVRNSCTLSFSLASSFTSDDFLLHAEQDFGCDFWEVKPEFFRLFLRPLCNSHFVLS